MNISSSWQTTRFDDFLKDNRITRIIYAPTFAYVLFLLKREIILKYFLYNNIIIFIALILILPICQIKFYFFPLLKKIDRAYLLKALSFLGLFISILFCIYIMFQLIKFLPYKFLLILFSLSLLFVIRFVYRLSLSIFDYIKEYLKIKKILKSNINHISRQQIANQLKSYKTAWARIKYIEYLQDKKIKPSGEWSQKGLPNFNNDEASILLAKLEEKWLGLDR